MIPPPKQLISSSHLLIRLFHHTNTNIAGRLKVRMCFIWHTALLLLMQFHYTDQYAWRRTLRQHSHNGWKWQKPFSLYVTQIWYLCGSVNRFGPRSYVVWGERNGKQQGGSISVLELRGNRPHNCLGCCLCLNKFRKQPQGHRRHSIKGFF